MALKAPPAVAPPAVAPTTWTGFYIGGTLGYGSGRSVQFFTASGGGTTGDYDISGIVGGGTVGYNWQFNANGVIGIEADWSGAHLRGTTPSSGTYGCGTVCDSRVDWFDTARVRIGYAAGDALLYATGGYAYARLGTDFSPGQGGVIAFSNRSGWTAGAGFEYEFTRNWSAKVEYLYLNFDNFIWTNAGGCFNLGCNTNDKFSVVRLGLNYKF